MLQQPLENNILLLNGLRHRFIGRQLHNRRLISIFSSWIQLQLLKNITWRFMQPMHMSL